MITRLFVLVLLGAVICHSKALAQKTVSIPAFTAYLVPEETSSEDEESGMISEKQGIRNWTDTRQKAVFYFKLRHTGNLELNFMMKAGKPGNRITVSCSGKTFTIPVPQSKEFRLVKAGSIQVKDTGFYTVVITPVKKTGEVVADIKSLELGGTAVENIHFNKKPRRNAASVHLFYPLADTVKVLSFYNELTVPEGSDVLYSYYMVCGFERGYFGIQVNSATERRVIFSVWDAGNEAVDRKKVTDENKVQLMAKGEDVVTNDFGNEGTGGHSHLLYNWRAGETYKFLVTAAVDTVAHTTTYAGYFFIPEMQKWKFVAAFKAPKDGKPLRRLYSFNENFWGLNGQLKRRASFGNQWIRKENGEWRELTTSRFSYDATGKAGDRIDYGGGTEGNRFYLWNGGFENSNARYNDTFTRAANGTRPVIDLYKNADSLAEAEKENETIMAAIKEGKLDTTGSSGGVYYKILTEGAGDFISVNDTVVVHYKGQLLNGFVFDQTKEKPATFPLRRLIRGWQTGLPYCRQGGKIRLVIPSAYAYTIRNSATIPPNSILVFDIEVLEARKQR